jgi:hypothetical protein
MLSTCLAAVLLAAPAPASAQNMAGTVWSGGAPLRGAEVNMLDAVNAEVLGSAITDYDGNYDSGPIPIGEYRVRFADQFSVGRLGSAAAEFCSATVVTVLPVETTTLDHAMVPLIKFGFGFKGTVAGAVRDAATGAALQGIEISVFGPADARLIASGASGADGTYAVELRAFGDGTVRVRFSDPSGAHLPRFYGAGGADVFCAAAAVPAGAVGVDIFMDRVPPVQVTQHLIDTIDSLGLPASVDATLSTPLGRLIDLLADENADNDAAGCGHMRGFLSRVDVQERKGQLSPAEADELRSVAGSLQALLGCP